MVAAVAAVYGPPAYAVTAIPITARNIAMVAAQPHANAARSADDPPPIASTGTFRPVRSTKTVVELTYQLQANSWWQLQPDFQYITNPSGGIENPKAPGQKVGDAGLRTISQF